MALFDRSDKDKTATPSPKAAKPEPTPAKAAAPAKDPEAPRYPSSGAPRASESALIGPGLKVEGEVRGDEDLILDGEVKGALALGQHQLLIGEAGRAIANVTARKVVVFGELTGDIEAKESVELGHTARVKGNIRTPKLRIDEGALLNGRVSMGKDGALPSANKAPNKSNGTSPESNNEEKAGAPA